MTFFLRRMALAGIAGSILGVFALVGAIKLLTWPASARLDSGRPGIPVEEVAISSNSGSRLATWFAQGRPGAGAVLLMHGVRGNRE